MSREVGIVGMPERFYLQLSLEHMKISFCDAINKHLSDLSSEIKSAVEELCTVDRVSALMRELTFQYVKEAVDSEVKAYFTYGPGRTEIKKRVEEALNFIQDEKGR